MRKIIIGMVLSFLIPMTAAAQQHFPRVEAFGGYSYFRANPEGFNLNGWTGSITGNLTDWFGITGDLSGHYGRPKFSGIIIQDHDINSHTFLFGPKMSLRGGRMTPFTHFMVGVSRAGATIQGESFSDNALAAAIGGGLDFTITNLAAIRVLQMDYLMTRFEVDGAGNRQNNFRFSTGIVFRF
jgi:hypothetical protein